MAFLTLFRVATGDNWNGIMKDTLRDECDDAADCVRNCCVSSFIAPIFFVIFVLMAQFVLVNVVVGMYSYLKVTKKKISIIFPSSCAYEAPRREPQTNGRRFRYRNRIGKGN